jgi:hypothetical protein
MQIVVDRLTSVEEAIQKVLQEIATPLTNSKALYWQFNQVRRAGSALPAQ